MGIGLDGVFYVLKTSYREAYARYGPGLVLFLSVIEELAAKGEGLRKIELLGEDARWKRELCTSGREVCTYTLYPRNMDSVRLLGYERISGIVKKIKRTLAPDHAAKEAGERH